MGKKQDSKKQMEKILTDTLDELVIIRSAFDDFTDHGKRGDLHSAGTVLGLAEKRVDELIVKFRNVLKNSK